MEAPGEAVDPLIVAVLEEGRDVPGVSGPLEDDQIVNGFIDEGRGTLLGVEVTDTINDLQEDTDVILTIGEEFNDEREA